MIEIGPAIANCMENSFVNQVVNALLSILAHLPDSHVAVIESQVAMCNRVAQLTPGENVLFLDTQ